MSQDFEHSCAEALHGPERDDAQEDLKTCLRALAGAQKQAGIRGIFSTVQANGDVIVSTVHGRRLPDDGKGSSAFSYIPYAVISRTGQLTILR
jgi:hypothetical protein